MKKVLFLLLLFCSFVSLTACTTTDDSTDNLTVDNVDVFKYDGTIELNEKYNESSVYVRVTFSDGTSKVYKGNSLEFDYSDVDFETPGIYELVISIPQLEVSTSVKIEVFGETHPSVGVSKITVTEYQKELEIGQDYNENSVYVAVKFSDNKVKRYSGNDLTFDYSSVNFNMAGTYQVKVLIAELNVSTEFSIKVVSAKDQYEELEKNWENYVTDVESSAPTRYQIISHTSDKGLYMYVEQYVNNIIISNDPSDWNSTHVEMEVWNHGMGYGWDGTYFAFFANGTYYINNWTNCRGVYCQVDINENSSESTYKYTISYNIYIAFSNNLDNPADGSYAFVQFMFLTPGEDESGYENVTTITKDDWRVLWTDKCSSYEVRSNGIVTKDAEWD